MTTRFKLKTVVSLVSSMTVLGAGSAIANQSDQDDMDILPDARSGECYAKVLVPPVYKTESVSVITQDATEKLTILPAKYTSSNERIMTKEASRKLSPVQPEFEEVTKRVKVSEAETMWVRDSLKGTISVSAGTLADLSGAGIDVDAAKPGQCFYEHFKPATYKTVDEKIMVSAATEELKAQPVVFASSEKQIMTKPASKRLVEVPTVFKTVEEKVLIEPAKSVWKKGRGPIQKIDHATGEIMCLVDIPAVYETVTRRAVAAPPLTTTVVVPAEFEQVKVRTVKSEAKEIRTPIPAKFTTVAKRALDSEGSLSWVVGANGNKVTNGEHTGNVVCFKETPAEWETITQRVVKTPGSFTVETVPAVYENVPVQKLVTDAKVTKLPVAATKKDYIKRIKVSGARQEWRPVLCETNMTDSTISDIQQALSAKGFNPGAIDGVLGQGTLLAIEKFQKTNNLARGGITYATLEALGIDLSSE